MAWTAHRALRRRDLSDDPGSKPEGGRQEAARSSPFGLGNKDKSSRSDPSWSLANPQP